MKCYLIVLLIYIISIKAQDDYEFYEYTNIYNDTPVFDLVELMKQPKLPGIRDENWPYREDESPLTQYGGNGCQSCQCGIKPIKRIVNGSFSKPHEFPWQVLFVYKGRFNCAGSVLNDFYTITAAHCLFGFKKEDLQLRFGLYKRHSQTGIFKNIDKMWISEAFNKKTLFHDIGLVKLIKKIRFIPTVQPICLPILGSSYAGELATVTGWGRIYYQGPVAEYLRKAQLPVLSNAQCRKTGYRNTITPSQLCAGNEGKDSCSGDSGGPLITLQDKRYRLIGVVSFGRECNKPNFPGVYTRVTSFYKKVVRLASENGACWCKDSD